MACEAHEFLQLYPREIKSSRRTLLQLHAYLWRHSPVRAYEDECFTTVGLGSNTLMVGSSLSGRVDFPYYTCI